MVTTTLPHATSQAPLTRPARDRAVDAARAVLLVIVVALHAFMVGVSRDDAGAPVLENAMDHWVGWSALTFAVQVMPLFFALGGFASYTQFTRLRARGTTAREYVASRLVRLMVPAACAIAAIALFLSALTVLQVPLDVVQTAGFRISQPFWFLAVYLGVSALVPVMVRLHERHRTATFIVLGAGALAVDIVRTATGTDAFGLLNLAFVWLFAQQLGFALADGTITALTTRARVGIVTGSGIAMAMGMASGLYPANLFAALNPPMGSLILAGIIQVVLFDAARGTITRVAEQPRVERVVGWINARAMTIYSWHMVTTIAIAGILLLSPLALPAPATAQWWLTRPLWFAVVGLAVYAVTAATGRWEMRRDNARTASPAVPALLLAIAGVVLVLVMGQSVASWVIATATAACAIALVMVPRRTSRVPA